MSISQLAMADQSGSGYDVDVWLDTVLEPMTKVWQGVGGTSCYFLSEEDARHSRGAYEGSKPYRFAETLWRLAQVQPHRTRGYRNEIAEFVVDLPVEVAMGFCQANGHHGSGGVFQYFIPDWDSKLFRTGRTYRFRSQSY